MFIDFCNVTAILASLYAVTTGFTDPAPLAVSVNPAHPTVHSAHPVVQSMIPYGPENQYWDITRDTDSHWIYMNPKSGNHQQTVIMMHGYQENATMFYDTFAKYMEAPADTKIILPQAQERWNPIWGGCLSNSWFTLIEDAKKTEATREQYKAGIYAPFMNQTEILTMTAAAHDLIEAERLLVPNQDSRRIYIGGMSQGALSSLDIFLTYTGSTPLGGVIIESGTMSLELEHRCTTAQCIEVQGNTPMFVYHGTADQVLNVDLSYISYAYLRDVVYKAHPENYLYQTQAGMDHIISPIEGFKVNKWLAARIASQQP